MKYLKTIFTTTLIVISLMLVAQTKNNNSILENARQFLLSQNKSQEYSIKYSLDLAFDETNSSITICHLVPQGFILFSQDKEILGYSFQNKLDILKSMDLLVYLSQTENTNKSILQAEVENQMWGPYVYNMWGQVNCTDNTGHTINVSNLFTPNHYAPGCVAVSQSTILRHYQWPPRGMGVSSYTDNQGNCRGTYTVDHENTEYDWANALNRYRSKASTDEEREAAGTIVYQSAVSLSMDFESNGSTSNVNRIPTALARHFRFTALYKSRGSSTFWSILDSNMVWAKPCVLAVENSAGGGHSVVCDGLKIENGDYFYHLNMGWWGASNGWYKIRNSFNAGGYNYVIGAAMNIIPEPIFDIPIVLDDAPMTELSWHYPQNGHAEAFEIQRSIDGGSWETITTTITDSSMTIFPTENHEYEYRARAIVNNGRTYANSWSKKVKLLRQYTGIEEQDITQILAYPSPFTKSLNITIDQNNHTTNHIQVFQLYGALVFEETTASALLNIDTESWEKGVYLIRVSNGKTTKTLKRIKY